MRAAARWGVSPTTFRKEWSRTDQLAALALLEYEQQTTSRVHKPCGHPIEQALNPLAEGWYEPYVVTCHACAAIAKKEHELKDSPGAIVYAVNTLPPGESLPPWQLPHVADNR